MKTQDSRFKIQDFLNKNIWFLLIVVVLIAGVLRFWQLGNIPSSPDWDEVALGYNAYSVIHTGRDEYGKFLPVVLRSFDDYKPALYMYLVIPAELVFGVTVFAVRFPSAFCGVLTVITIFFLMKELFKRNDISLLISFLYAISPWSIQFSRLGFETNVGLTLNILAALFFLKGLKKPWLLSISTASAALALYVYQSEKVFTPLFMFTLLIIYRKKLFAVSKKYLFLGALVGIIVALPMLVYITTDKQALLRVKGTSIFNSPTVYLKDDPARLLTDQSSHDYLGLMFDNRRVIYAREIIGGYLSHYNVNWLIRGDIERHHAPNMGLIYIIEIPFILIGLYILAFGKFDKTTKQFLFAWFLLAPVPASITTGVPHAVRTMNFLPTWQVFSALGLLWFFAKIASLRYRLFTIKINYVIFGVFTLLSLFNISYYLNQYFVQLNYYDPADWQYGYAQVIPVVEALKSHYKKVVVSEKYPLDKSYMFFLFYLQYSPSDYQLIGEHSSGGFTADHHFSIFSFRPLNWEVDKKDTHVLYVGAPEDFPKGINTIKTIYYPNGQPAVEVVGT